MNERGARARGRPGLWKAGMDGQAYVRMLTRHAWRTSEGRERGEAWPVEGRHERLGVRKHAHEACIVSERGGASEGRPGLWKAGMNG